MPCPPTGILACPLSVVPKSSRRLDTPSSGLNCGQVVIDRQRRKAVMKTQMDAAHIPTSTGAVAEVSAPNATSARTRPPSI